MLILKLWNYIMGYVIILVEGNSIEKFINICVQKRILIWDIQKAGPASARMKMALKHFRKVRAPARAARCRVSLVSKVGLPFLLRRYRKRKTFILGAFVCLILFNILISFIWIVEIDGNKNTSDEEINAVLLKHGIRPGILKYNVNTDNIANALMLEIDELSWTGVSVRGTKLKVSVRERRIPPELVDTDEPCNIIAAKDGMIESIYTQKGTALVKEGDTVIKGQVLVSGVLKNKHDENDIKLVHALAEVRARTWYEGSASVEDTVVEEYRTGDEEKLYYIELFNRRYKLPFQKLSFDRCEKLETVNRLSLGNDLVMPFGFITEHYFETGTRIRKLSEEEAQQRAADRAYALALDKVPIEADIRSTSLNYKYDKDGKSTAIVIIECIENIGMKSKIGG